ncbi:MAG: hypothetical protein Kow0037_15060 [Calditrichia bacterium]
MGFLDSLFLPPSADHLHLIKYILMLVYFIHFPFISLMLGGTLFSLFYYFLGKRDKNELYIRLSQDWIDKLVFRKSAGIILGILPLFILFLIEGQILYGANIMVPRFLMYSIVLIATGMTLIYFYQGTVRILEEATGASLLFGGLGILFLMGGYLLFSTSSALLLDPGRWATVKDLPHLLFSWNVVARSAHFFFAALTISAIGLYFLKMVWPEREELPDADYGEFLRKTTLGLAFGLTLLQPPFIFWNVVTMPNIALSEKVIGLAIAVLLVILMVSVYLYRMLNSRENKYGYRVVVLFLVAFLLIIADEHYARENAGENHSAILIAQAEALESEIEARREAEMASMIKVDLNLGKQVFTNQCTSCHQFDKKVVGPAYNEVLDKYASNVEALEKFIQNPQKINPDFPAMPKLGLNLSQTKSVAAFLLQEYQKKQEGTN